MRTIPNYPDYSITPDGKVWSHKSNRFRKLQKNNTCIQLEGEVNGKRKRTTFLVSILVSLAYPESVKPSQELKPIPGLEKYSITKEGKVFSSVRHRWLKNTMNTLGYLVVGLGQKVYLIHRLVALTYIPNPENKPQIDHINRHRFDNRITNLKWTTQKENMANKAVGRGCVCFRSDFKKRPWRYHWSVIEKKCTQNFATKEEAEAYRIIVYQLRVRIRKLRGLSY